MLGKYFRVYQGVRVVDMDASQIETARECASTTLTP